jgi:hypothetical protein
MAQDMNRLSMRFVLGIVLAAALLGNSPTPAQEATLQLAELPESVKRLAAAAESRTSTPATADTLATADASEEIVVRGRSKSLLRDRVVAAEDKVHELFNRINTIDEFDIHCRMHATTGTRIVQRVCAPNFEKEKSADRGQAILASMRGEAFGTNWQIAEAEMRFKASQFEDHMKQLARENPDLLQAMRELVEAMQAASQRPAPE